MLQPNNKYFKEAFDKAVKKGKKNYKKKWKNFLKKEEQILLNITYFSLSNKKKMLYN